MRLFPRLILPATLATALAAGLCFAPAARAAGPDPVVTPDPVVAKVGGAEIHLSDVQAATQELPAQYQSMPLQMLYPQLLDQLVGRQALVIAARKAGLDKDPAVAHAMARAADEELQSAYLRQQISPQITDAALHARYDHDIAGKPGEPEVHARHILVDSEAEAQDIIKQINAGADFAKLAKEKSSDHGSADSSGGDLGWFKKGEMVPEFADAAFSLKPGQLDDKPVKSQFGWHVIQVLETRTAPPPSFEDARDGLRSDMINEDIKKLLASARQGVKIETFNPDGTAPRATDSAQPPAAAKAPAPQTPAKK